MQRHRSAVSLLLGCSSFVHAEVAADAADLSIFDILDRTTVVATLTSRAQKDVISEVRTIGALEIDRRRAQNIRDLIRYEPGVSVTGSMTRFGFAAFSIRGLESNRARIETDDVAVPDSFSIGNFSNAARDMVAMDALKRVEIVRGAASSPYGRLRWAVWSSLPPRIHLGDRKDWRCSDVRPPTTSSAQIDSTPAATRSVLASASASESNGASHLATTSPKRTPR